MKKKNENKLLAEVEAFADKITNMEQVPNTAVIVFAADTDTGETHVCHKGTAEDLYSLLAVYLSEDVGQKDFDLLKREAIKYAVGELMSSDVKKA